MITKFTVQTKFCNEWGLEHFVIGFVGQKMSEFKNVQMVVKIPEKLKEWWRNMKQDDKREAGWVEKKLGNLIHLLEIPSDRYLVQALLPFWSYSRAVFQFKDFELTPTLEEMADLTGLPLKGREMIIPRKQGGRHFLDDLGLYNNKKLGCFANEWVSLDYLYERFAFGDSHAVHIREFACSLDTWKKRRFTAFVISFFGTLIFPREEGKISTSIGSVVRILLEGIDNKEVTVVPMILAEMFRALTNCRKKNKRYFEGSNLLLQLWAMEHLFNRKPIVDIALCGGNPIRSYQERVLGKFVAPVGLDDWFGHLAQLEEDHILWKVWWLATKEGAYLRSKEKYYIELIGLTGLHHYAPLRVLRQFGIEQVIPLTAYTRSYEIEFGKEVKVPRVGEIFKDWDRMVNQRASFHQAGRTPEYYAWIKEDIAITPSPAGKEGLEDVDRTYGMKVKLSSITFTPYEWSFMKEVVETVKRARIDPNHASTSPSALPPV